MRPETISSRRALSVGVFARGLLERGARGEVLAVFARSFYVGLPGGCVCVGDRGVGDGALNLRCDGPAAGGALPAVVAPGMPAVCEQGLLRVGDAPAVAWRHAATWRPLPAPAARADVTGRGLALLDGLLARHAVGDEGLGGFAAAAPPALGLVARRAAAPVAALRDWLAAGAPSGTAGRAGDAAGVLLGLGPGLTPSGDDFLAGVLIALHKTRHRRALARLWRLLEPRLADGTHAISAAHLRAAACGAGAAVLDEAVDALVRADAARIGAALRALAGHGHTSGRDALAGAAVTLRALRDAAAARGRLAVGV